MQKWIYILLAILSFSVFGNTIYNKYSLDDDYIKSSIIQKGISGIPELIKNRFGIVHYDGRKTQLDYRPISLMSFAIENQFFGQNPAISHFFNILLFTLSLLVLYKIFTEIIPLQKTHRWLPFFVLCFFTIHPVHTEVVASLKNRDELFAFLFGLLFLLYGFRYFAENENKTKNFCIALISLVISFLSKQVAVLYFPIFVLILYYNGYLKKNKNIFFTISGLFISLVLGVYIISLGVKREVYFYENSLVGETNPWIILLTCFKVLLYHTKLLLVSYPLRFYYGHNMFPLQSNFDLLAIFSIIFHITLLIYGIHLIRKKQVIGFFILCYLSSISLYFNFPFKYTGMFSERALLLSSVWFIACIVTLITIVASKVNNKLLNNLLMFFGIVAFSIYAIISVRRNYNWETSLTLTSHDIPYLENSIGANYIHANALNYECQKTNDSIYSNLLAHEAIKYYQREIKLYPEYPDCFFQIAYLTRYKLNDLKKATKFFENMLKIDSTYTSANYELGKIYFEQKDFQRSYPYLTKAYQTKPTDSLLLFYLGQNTMAIGKSDECYQINKQFLSLYPNLTYPYLNMGIYYSSILKDDSAVIYLDKAIELGDRNPELLKNMIIYYSKKNNPDKAKYYEKLLRNPL